MNYSLTAKMDARRSRQPWQLLSFTFLHSARQRAVAGALALVLAIGFAFGSGAAQANDANSANGATIVNINKADAQALAAGLRGVGASRAQEIVRHREAFGPFASADELLEVKGIGKSTLDMNRKRITLE